MKKLWNDCNEVHYNLKAQMGGRSGIIVQPGRLKEKRTKNNRVNRK